MPARVGGWGGGWIGGLEGCANWDGGGIGGWHGLFLLQAEMMLQLVQAEQELLKGGPLTVVRVHADVCQLLQNKKRIDQASGSGYGMPIVLLLLLHVCCFDTKVVRIGKGHGSNNYQQFAASCLITSHADSHMLVSSYMQT